MLYSTKSPIDKLMSIIDEESIMKFYCKELFKVIKSPLHKDENPSFSTFYTSNNKLRFTDFSLGIHGDCFELVKRIYDCSPYEALLFIDRDMNLGIFSKDIELNKKTCHLIRKQINIPKEKIKYKVRIHKREWHKIDYDFWNKFGISKSTCDYFNVYPIKDWWLGSYKYYLQNIKHPAYAYKLGSRYKIYMPNEIKSNKFRGNCNYNTIQGWNQLNKTKKYLIITSSLKEVMLLHELGYHSIAPNAESVTINPKFINAFKKYFKLILFYDFDEAGINLSQKHSEIYECKRVNYSNNKTKDLSDFYKEYGKEKTIELINKILKPLL